MRKETKAGLIFAAGVTVMPIVAVQQTGAADAPKMHVMYEKTVTGFAFPESCAYDPAAKVLYVGNFGGAKLDTVAKDGNGRIAKVALDGTIIESRFLPDVGDVLNKPKGIWVKGSRLWVTDIDSVWEFDLKSRAGRKLPIPGITFANDPTVKGNALYVSDNRADLLFKIEPADFMNAKNPKITKVLSGKDIYPNGLYPGNDGSLLIAGFKSDKEPRGIYALNAKGEVKQLLKNTGRLDGLYQMKDGTILATNWDNGSLFSWTEKDGVQILASDFKGPADLCVVPEKNGLLVVVPDLVKSELRMVKLVK